MSFRPPLPRPLPARRVVATKAWTTASVKAPYRSAPNPAPGKPCGK